MAVTTRTHVSGQNKLIVTKHGQGETLSNTVLVDRSTLTGPDGASATAGSPRIRVDEIYWAIQSDDTAAAGLNAILLEFDDATDEVIAYLPVGEGYKDFRPYGGYNMSGTPNAAADGDIIATNIGTVAGTDTFDITLNCTLKL